MTIDALIKWTLNECDIALQSERAIVVHLRIAKEGFFNELCEVRHGAGCSESVRKGRSLLPAISLGSLVKS